MTQWIDALAANPDGLSSIFGTHMEEREHQLVFSPPRVYTPTQISKYAK